MKKLTDRQFEVVKFIYEGQKKGITPTLFELAEELGVSSRQTVKDLLDAVIRKGYLHRKPHRARAILLKPEAIAEIEAQKDFFEKVQLSLGISYSGAPNYFQWAKPTNILINQGELSSLQKALIDSSSIIPMIDLATTSLSTEERFSQIQFVAEKSNFDHLNASTSRLFIENYNYLVVTPNIPNSGDINGYLIPDGHQLYEIVWSGININHYFYFGKEYGSTQIISYVENFNSQMKLFPTSINIDSVGELIIELKEKVRSWSQYVDFPIYGAAMKKNGDIIFWSKKTGRDVNDLRYFFLADITQTNFQGNDKALLRDIAYNFPNLLNNNLLQNYVISN